LTPIGEFLGNIAMFPRNKLTVSPAEMMRFWRPSNGLAFAIIASNYSFVILIMVVAAGAKSFIADAIALILIAGRQVAFLNIIHAAAHGSLFSRRPLNESLDWLFAYMVFDSVKVYRPSHLEHHRDFRLRDPERLYYLHKELMLPKRGALGRTWVVFIRPLLGHSGWGFVFETVQILIQNPRFAVKLLVYWVSVVGLCYWYGWLWSILFYWLLPLVWLYPVFSLWAEVGDHFQVPDISESRNYKGWIWRVLIKPYETHHCIHHMYPHIPFYRHAEADAYLVSQGVRMEILSSLGDFLRVVYSFSENSELILQQQFEEKALQLHLEKRACGRENP
jgi:fatty acid desaturase